ncbi:MAG: hypothetical protein JXB47_12520 [Anaerolineae bacterium]|nr:hypothetical protein [Anaerolineae bacterium]
MAQTLYVANFPPGTTEDQLRELFAEQGQVTSVALSRDEKFERPYALVEMASEKVANKANQNLNGHKIDGFYLAVSNPEINLKKKMSTRLQQTADEICEQLGETQKVPVRRINAIVLLCGFSFAQALVKETEEVEAAGGLMTSDGSRRRSKGGVFFYLARGRMSPEVRQIVYNRKGKLPKPEDEPPQVQEAPEDA